MKPRLGKKGRKALAAKKKAAPKKKARAVKSQAPAPEPQKQEQPVEHPQAQAPEESGVGDGCAVGGSESEAGPEFNPA